MRPAHDCVKRRTQFVRNRRQEFIFDSIRILGCYPGLLQIFDVGVGAEPANDVAMFVANRYGAGEEPAIAAVAASQWKGIFPHFAGFPRTLDERDYTFQMIRVQHLGPTPALDRKS